MPEKANIQRSKRGFSKIGISEAGGYGALDLPEIAAPSISATSSVEQEITRKTQHNLEEANKQLEKIAPSLEPQNVPRETLEQKGVATLEQEDIRENIADGVTQESNTFLSDWERIGKEQQAVKFAHDKLVAENPELKNAHNYDHDDHGFDVSDKLSMLGAVSVGMGVGVTEFAARAMQVLGTASDLVNMAIPYHEAIGLRTDTGKRFTNWFNREESRIGLIKDAEHAHPWLYEGGKIIGGTLPLLAMPWEAAAEEAGTAIVGATSRQAMAQMATGAEKLSISLMDKALRTGAAKSIINAKKVGFSTKMLQLLGENAVIGETMYDPENNHYLSQGAIGAVLGVAMHGAGNLVKAGVGKLGGSIKDVSNKFGLSLPAMPSLELVAQLLPGNLYDKLMKERRIQASNIAGDLVEKIITEGKDATLQDMSSRIVTLEGKLQNPLLEYHIQEKLTKQLDGLKKQQELIKSSNPSDWKMGNKMFLGGRLKKAVDEKGKIVGKLNSQIEEHLGENINIEKSKSIEVAEDILKEQGEVLPALRRPMLNKISRDLIGKNPKLMKKFAEVGVKDPEQIAEILSTYYKGEQVDAKIHKTMSHILQDVDTILRSNGLINPTEDFNEIVYNLLSPKKFNYKAMRDAITELGPMKYRGTVTAKRDAMRLYGSIQDDMEKHILKYGKGEETLGLYREQARIRRDEIELYNKPPYNDYRTDNHNADKFIGEFFKPGEPQLASQTIKMLKTEKNGDAGLLASRAAIINESFERSFIPRVGINPVKFMEEVMHLADLNNVVFSKSQNEAFKGYIDLIHLIKEVSPKAFGKKAMEGVEEEISLGGLKMTHGVLKSLGYGVAGIGSAMFFPIMIPLMMTGAVFSKIVTSPKGRELMSKVANMKQPSLVKEADSVFSEFLGIAFSKALKAAKVATVQQAAKPRLSTQLKSEMPEEELKQYQNMPSENREESEEKK